MFSAAASRTAGSAAPSVKRAEHVADDAAQPVVDLDLGHLGFGGLAGRRAGDRIEQADIRAGFLDDEDLAVGLADGEIAFGECGQRLLDGGIAGGAELAHDGLDRRETLGGGEFGDDRAQCGFVGVGWATT